jgi:LysM repeat protein
MKEKYSLVAVMAVMLSALLISASVPDTPQEKYVAKYAVTAVREMYRSGVPASITLAQGLLESRAGQAPLAVKGNNHFGIKCHDWTGAKMYQDDDSPNECFRTYADADESFRDHSDFLRYKDRYKFLFDNDVTDYKSWAYGLKKAGYATDPAYPAKLIKLIEDYHLYDYDRMTVKEAEKASGIIGTGPIAASEEEMRPSGEKKAHKFLFWKSKKSKKAVVDENPVEDRIPASPLSIEQPKPLANADMEEFRFSLSRQLYSKNGVPFVYSVEGETYSSIAEANHLFIKELLRFNDLGSERSLLPGTIVYLQSKKSQAAKGLDKYIVGSDDETLWDICQRFGVKMKSIIKLNNFTDEYVPREGDTILLRGETVGSRLFNKKNKNISYD